MSLTVAVAAPAGIGVGTGSRGRGSAEPGGTSTAFGAAFDTALQHHPGGEAAGGVRRALPQPSSTEPNPEEAAAALTASGEDAAGTAGTAGTPAEPAEPAALPEAPAAAVPVPVPPQRAPFLPATGAPGLPVAGAVSASAVSASPVSASAVSEPLTAAAAAVEGVSGTADASPPRAVSWTAAVPPMPPVLALLKPVNVPVPSVPSPMPLQVQVQAGTASAPAVPALAAVPPGSAVPAGPAGPAVPVVPVVPVPVLPVSAVPLAAPAAPPAPAHRAPLLAQVASPLIRLAATGPAGEHVITLSVTPENLGPLTVRAHIGGDGVRMELFAPNDTGREALRLILADLRRDLAGAPGPGPGAASLTLSEQNSPGDPSGAGSGTQTDARSTRQRTEEPAGSAESAGPAREAPSTSGFPGSATALDVMA